MELKIIREKTVCFTGHRSEKLPKGEALEKLRQRLENEIERAIQDGYDTFSVHSEPPRRTHSKRFITEKEE